MTVTDLLAIPPADLARLTDAELTAKLSPLFPLARSAYIGPKTATVMVGSTAVSKREYAKKRALIDSLLATLNTQPPKP